MGITEAASRKILLMKVRKGTEEYYLGIFYFAKPGWQIARDLKDDLPAMWKDLDSVPCEELDYLEGERFSVRKIPCYIRGENKGNPKWEADENLTDKNTLTKALAWLKKKIRKNRLEIIVSDPEVDPYEQKA